jgi:hypothetical protein
MAVTRSGFQTLVNSVWTLVSLVGRSVNVEMWRGVQPNPLVDGRVDAYLTSTMKQGMQLVAGSYSPVKQVQHFSIAYTMPANTGAGDVRTYTLPVAVNPAKSFLMKRDLSPFPFGDYYEFISGGATLRLVNTASNGSGTPHSSTQYLTIVEFW